MEMAVILCRKSDENAEADDFAIQEDICRAYAASKGYGVHAVYREAHSGKHSPQTRTVLRQAIGDIKSGRASVLVIRSFDRLARTIEQSYSILFEVEQMHHGRIEAAQEQIDRTSAMAKAQFTLVMLASEMERDRVYERLTAGKKRRAARGHLTGGPNARFGYRYVDDIPGQRTAYAVNPETAPIVQRIFEQAGQGMALRAIARGLNVDGIPTPSSYAASQQDTGTRRVGKYWQVEQLRSILKDSRYAGRAVLFRYATTRDQNTGKRSHTLNEHPMPAPDETWPAIVTEEQFALATLRQQKQVAGRKPLIQALLRGHAYCGLCGGTLGVTTIQGGKATVYRCRHRIPNDEMCPGVEIRQETLDEHGWNAVKTLLMLREPFVKLLRERFASTRDGEILASAAGALREKQEEQQTLAASVGLTTNAAVRQAIIAQMETVAEEVQKLEAAYQEAQQVEEREQAAEAWIQSTLDKIYGWRTTWAQTVDAETEMFYTTTPLPDLDELPFDLKRVAVEASGIVVKLYPVGSEERIQVAFNQSISGTTIDSNDSALVEVATPGRRR